MYKREELRKVLCSFVGIYDYKKKSYTNVENVEGYFHTWGLDVEEGESYSVGLVELEDGSMVSVVPDYIKFLD